MSLVDSTAAFTLRCDEIEDTKQMGLLLGRQGINTFSSLAFAIGTPNQQPTDAVFDQFAQRVFTLPSMGQTGKLRRLHFESQTYVLAQLKVAVSKKLPVPEKQARIADLKHRLNGVVLEGEKEPAYSLIDMCQTIYDTGNIVWIHPSKCHERDSEVKASVKDPKQIVKVESQALRIENETTTEEADHGTELKLMWCLQRRGFALDMTGVVSWDVHEKWVDALCRSYSSDVSQATRPVTLSQLIKADCELWTLLAREHHTVKPNAHGDKPLDLAISRLQHDPRIIVYLMPQPIGRHGATQSELKVLDDPKPKKRPGKRGRTPPNVPAELKDCHQQTANGEPICWAYNLATGCKAKTGGNPPACNRGAHVCAFCRKIGHVKCRNAPGAKDSAPAKPWLEEDVELKRPRTMGPVSLASEPLKGEHGVHGASDSSGVGGVSNDIDSNIDQTGVNSFSKDVTSQSELTVSSSGSGQVKRSASDAQRGSRKDQQQHHEQVAEKFDDSGLVQKRTSFDNLLCIEIFSGSGKLTATIRRLGLRAVAIDRSSSRTSGPVTHLDLTTREDLDFLKNFIASERENLIYVHLAPPCGTCSAARNKQRKDWERAGFSLPQPLRSKLHPMGLPHIRGLDAAKVASANLLYQATFEIVMLCIELDVLCTVENPENSLFWDTDPMRRLFEICEGFHNVFQSCMMGGDRDKRTKWWSSKNYFSAFNIMCDGLHSHKAWTPTITEKGLNFPTKEEAAYPQLLCDRVSHVVKALAIEMGFNPTESLLEQSKQQTTAALQHVNMGFLPRGKKLKPLVSEFSQYKTWIFQANQSDNQVERVMDKFPKGTRIVHRKLLKWGEVRVGDVDGKSLQNSSNYTEDQIAEKVSFGIPREPEDFVKEAIKAGHPRFLDYRSINEIDTLLEQNLDAGAFEILSKRTSWLKRWTDRAQELSHDEVALHRSLKPHWAAVLRGKRLLLFGEMLREISYPDVHLIQDICDGFRITGWLRDSGCFERMPKQPTMTVSNLLATARGLNQAVISRANGMEDDDPVRAAWDETQLELEKEWIWLDRTNYFSGLSLTHRFGLQQKKRVRVIDNFKTSGVNSTCGSPEKQKLYGLNFLATTLVRALSLKKSGGPHGLCGKTFDLSSAYKQFPLHQFDGDFIRLAAPEPVRKACAIYGVNALPFGATGSVSGFLRVSTALSHIIAFGLGVWAGTFFDDFPILCRGDLANQTEQQVSLLLDLLGMRFAREGKKWMPFSEQMEVLGVVIDLSHFDQYISNILKQGKPSLMKSSRDTWLRIVWRRKRQKRFVGAWFGLKASCLEG